MAKPPMMRWWSGEASNGAEVDGRGIQGCGDGLTKPPMLGALEELVIYR